MAVGCVHNTVMKHADAGGRNSNRS
jgi:hypothetical protein